MAQQAIEENPEITKTLKKIVKILPNLFKKMKKSRVILQLMNLPHDKPYQGEPDWKHLQQIDPNGVRLEKEGLAFMHENAIYCIHHPRDKDFLATLESFLKWATKSLKQLNNGVIDHMRTLQVPQSIRFFSLSTLPPRKRIPAFG